MKELLEKEYKKMHKKGGSPPKMTAENKLYAALKYLREYRGQWNISAEITASVRVY